MICWICNKNEANSREHRHKKSAVKDFFTNVRKPTDLPLVPSFNEYPSSRLPGPDSEKIKYPPIICKECNNKHTQPFDKQYDNLVHWCRKNPDAIAMNFSDVFGSDYKLNIQYLYRFFAKSLGCEIIDRNLLLPDNYPNPLQSLSEQPNLLISICRSHPFRYMENYTPNLANGMLGKLPFISSISKSYLEETGLEKIRKVIWGEQIGAFQINYWLNINYNPIFGLVVDTSTTKYDLIECDLDLFGIKEEMESWMKACCEQ